MKETPSTFAVKIYRNYVNDSIHNILEEKLKVAYKPVNNLGKFLRKRTTLPTHLMALEFIKCIGILVQNFK